MSLNNLATAAAAKADAELNNPRATAGDNRPPALDAIYSIAKRLGRLSAAGESAVTQLAFGFQRMVAAGDASEAHAGPLYVAHLTAHNEWVERNPHLGKALKDTAEKAVKSSISQFRSFGRKGPRELGQSDDATVEGLYAAVLRMRAEIGADNLAQKSAYGSFVKVNREVAALCEKIVDKANFPAITDAMLRDWLSAKPKAEASDLEKAIEAMRKATEARPGDLALNEMFRLIERYAAIAAVESKVELPKMTSGTNFAWSAPIVSGPVA
jgi:hypothetical protein